MSFPSLKSIRISNVSICGKKIKIQPWTNRDILRYEHAKDEVNERIASLGEVNIFEKKQMFMDIIFDHLVLPNIDYKGGLTQFEKEVLFIEIYKISRGTIINLNYVCSQCKGSSENQFNIDKNFTFTEFKVGEIKTKNMTFTTKQSSLDMDSLYEVNEEDKILYYYFSFILDFTYKNETFVVEDLGEFVKWMLEEVDETNFNELVTEIQKRTPSISLKTIAHCDFCGHKEDFTFVQLPDFSLVTL